MNRLFRDLLKDGLNHADTKDHGENREPGRDQSRDIEFDLIGCRGEIRHVVRGRASREGRSHGHSSYNRTNRTHLDFLQHFFLMFSDYLPLDIDVITLIDFFISHTIKRQHI